MLVQVVHMTALNILLNTYTTRVKETWLSTWPKLFKLAKIVDLSYGRPENISIRNDR